MPRRSFVSILAWLLLLIDVPTIVHANDSRRHFNVAAGEASETLKQFAAQAQREIMFPVDAVAGVRTNAVKGALAPHDALARMVARTPLVVVHDEETGAFMVRSGTPSRAKTTLGPTESSLEPGIPGGGNRQERRAGTPNPATTWLGGVLATAANLVGRSNAPPRPEGDQEPVVLLSPFEVVSDNKGYYAGTTTSGTRINSRLDDLAAAISVVTKEQMQDFALLDMNDIFNYEVSTEGTGNYTDFMYNRNGEPESMTEFDPQVANRVRGLAPANITIGNFETSGRVPIDPLLVDGVEISRGPNASIFGIGSPGGTINSVPAAANLGRDKSQISVRVDSFGGHRSTIDLNRVLKRDVLAVRGSAVYQHDGFNLKPSGLDTVRLNAMARYRPFKSTMISGSYWTYRMHGNRPNIAPPRETISGWRAAGAPTWDPIARTVRSNGSVIGALPAGIPAFFTAAPHNVFTNYYIDRNGVGYVSSGQSTLTTDPNVANAAADSVDVRSLVNIVDDPAGYRTGQPLYARVPGAADKAIYDWSSINLSAGNRIEDRAEIATLLLDHVFLETPRQLIATQAGWLRETTERFSRNSVGLPSNVATVQGLHIDVNERRLDGTPNPYFLRPFYGAVTPLSTVHPIDRDTVRLQAAYKLDLRREKNGLRWLGMHQVTAYAEYKEIASRQTFYYHAITDKHSWLGAGVAHAGRGNAIGGMTGRGPNIALGYFRYYLGDNRGYNVDHAPGQFNAGTYTMNFGNENDGFIQENITVSPAAFAGGGVFNELTRLKSRGAIIQSHLFNDRVVTTLGIRRDQRFSRNGASFRLLPDGVNVDYSAHNTWSTNDWSMGKGPTRTAGIVVKPLSWLSVYANRSDSFEPAPVNQDLYLQLITDPTGRGEDFGVGLNLFEGKLHVRAGHYKTMSLDRRGGLSQAPWPRLRGLDFANARYGRDLETRAGTWVDSEAAAHAITLTPEQRTEKIAGIMQLPVEYLKPQPTHPTNAVEDNIAVGTEIEIHYNPTNHWTLKANLAKQESIVQNMAPEINRWLAERLKVWESIVDPTTGRPWFTERYDNLDSAKQFLESAVIGPLALSQALEGKSRPQIRKYRVNVITSFRLAGITDHAILKRFGVGGAVRWEDKAAIGYHGVQRPPALVTGLDASRPIYDKARLHLDAFLSYRTRVWSDAVTATWQLNIRNLQESGRLQPIAADPDGTYTAHRIVTPRQFILSVTFDL